MFEALEEKMATSRQRGLASITTIAPAATPQELLRALTRVDEKRPDRRAGAMMGASVVTTNPRAKGQQERRVTAVHSQPPATPRRVPGTPRRPKNSKGGR